MKTVAAYILSLALAPTVGALAGSLLLPTRRTASRRAKVWYPIARGICDGFAAVLISAIIFALLTTKPTFLLPILLAIDYLALNYLRLQRFFYDLGLR
jgi:hypothetical protein